MVEVGDLALRGDDLTGEAVRHVAARIRRTQEILERRIAVENASFYTPLASDLSESEFLRAIIAEADCDLLLDVNNVYVNSVNHRYDAHAFIDAIPAERVRYLHIAGHYNEAADLIVDTHGADVIDPVWALLDYAYARIGPRQTLLERDFNVPPLAALYLELRQIRQRHALASLASLRETSTPLSSPVESPRRACQ